MRNPHPYLRAYMAGITVPTVFLLVILTVYTASGGIHGALVSVERIIAFPMAVVPNLWGLWNMLYVRLTESRRLPLGVHGALLPFLLVPAGFALAHAASVPWFAPSTAALLLPAAIAIYYLVWKHLVGFFNELLGVA